jgi:hypothetical protein
LLHSVGLPQLAVTSLRDYEMLALRLSQRDFVFGRRASSRARMARL